MNEIICGDALAVLQSMPGESIHCVCTSPPYFGLRDYGCNGQIGLEETPELYICRLTQVFREVRRVLKPDGVCWVNIGDSVVYQIYCNSSVIAKKQTLMTRPTTILCI